MSSPVALADCIAYLQREGVGPQHESEKVPVLTSSAARLLSIRGVGSFVKYADPTDDRKFRGIATTDVLIGAYGRRISPVFVVSGTPDRTEFRWGVWSAAADGPSTVEQSAAVVRTLLSGIYPQVDLAPGQGLNTTAPIGGIALGTPSFKPPEVGDVGTPWDRIVRAMRGTSWSVVVQAAPVAERAIATMRDGVLNEIRLAQTIAASQQAASPLGEHYIQLLRALLDTLHAGLSVGAWRTAVYLLGDNESYPRLAALWRSTFAGPESVPEPVRVFDWPMATRLAAHGAIADAEGAPGPSSYRRPVEYQTVLSSAQLAAYMHLPELETPGFAVNHVARFDSVSRAAIGMRRLLLGNVVHGGADTSSTYAMDLNALTRHAFVGGLTGAGKTNTIVSILEQIDAASIPFLVVEPAKAEYRSLLAHPRIGPRLRVFTVGDESVSPFRLNPFEVPDGTRVGEHLDLLRAVFAAAFGMWTPLPQVLERCLHEVYIDRGWDLTSGANARLGSDTNRWEAFPTLTELVDKVSEIVPTLGYEDRIAADIRAALVTRLDSLRRGAKGAMFDVAQSLPMAELVSQPTVLELESLADESDKAFMMGLLLIRIVEYRRHRGQYPGLAHLLVVEEAHRLLANVPPRASEESANARGQAVESFANLLSEIRVYGQGVVIADQIPVKLAPDVIKNTNLKIAHRIVAADDRAVLGATMAMDEAQARSIAALVAGQAAVFSEGDDAPVLVRFPLLKDALAAIRPDQRAVIAHMHAWRSSAAIAPIFHSRPFCAITCATPSVCEAARRIVGDEAVKRAIARTVLSTIEDPSSLDRMWDDLLSVIRSRRPGSVQESALLRGFAGHAAHWYAERRGSQAAWSYENTGILADLLREVLLDKIADGTGQVRRHLAAKAYALHDRTFLPYPHCQKVCTQEPAVCLYRWAVADLVASQRFQPHWRQADANDASSASTSRAQTWQICQDAGYEIIEYPEPDWPDDAKLRSRDAARRVCLCFEQQMLADDVRKVPRTSRRVMAQLLRNVDGS